MLLPHRADSRLQSSEETRGAGLQAQIRSGHLALFGAFGRYAIPTTETYSAGLHTGPPFGSWALGARGYLNGDGRGLSFALEVMRTEDRLTNPFVPGHPLERFLHFAAVVGWRFRLGSTFFLDAAAGPILNIEKAFHQDEPGYGTLPTTAVSVGLLHDTAVSSSSLWYTPTLDLGFGVEF